MLQLVLLFADLQLLVDFELFEFDFLDDFEIRYATHGSLVLVGPFDGVEVFKGVGFIDSVGFGESVGYVGNRGFVSVGAGVLPVGVGFEGWGFAVSMGAGVDGVVVGSYSAGAIVGFPNALLQNAGHALATSLTVTHPTLSSTCTGLVSLPQFSN